MKIKAATTRKKTHLISGALLGAFVICHFLNHALGLVSVEAMEDVRLKLNFVWRSLPGTVLLYGAVFVHFIMALDSLYRRHTLRMPAREAIKIVFGLSLPFLLIPHVLATRVEWALGGVDLGYPDVLHSIWSSTDGTIRQSMALIVAWTHFCLGLWFWMRGRSWFPRYSLTLYSVAILVPVLALLGFVTAARGLAPPTPSDPWVMAMRPDPHLLEKIRVWLVIGFGAPIAAVLAWRALPTPDKTRIRYPNGRVVAVGRGFSVLEASRSAGIPHVSVCGGRGRCSTCRVRVLQGLEGQPLPDEAEKATLERIGAPANVRLACQFRPLRDVYVAPIVNTDSLGLKTQLALTTTAGRERRIAALFCDLRDFTRLAEHKLPFDTVFLLNRYFETVGEAVESAGGIVDKFVGDGAIALFGLETSFEEACRQALEAAARLAEGIETLNDTFSAELSRPLRIAIGLHAGTAIIGRIGYGKATSLTAIGDTINTASRLEGVAKERDAELVVSEEVVRNAGVVLDGHERMHIDIRGREASVETWIIPRAREIVASLMQA
ncbi:adenylate/guanylate cyclase domain-containing protein [Rhizobiaceae bacterium n13]|uniref:Adenylate/guanylate cyclase domain-containing protein n=1 Tax=Ferirhizobium litorale TaxID=2927786 RepID=A0AAE3QCS4_9HYPH|nr:adenylate/guanylate cyclase domain-containing protein [Fererhizobium litorale]MDI7860691.1 adenylate/guanylate cyclase domain-containing protein [Fererhizobium litorale]MDI7920839.1 adenylate/guanylate cyclase domain-containing protein [Fererhizobium litorale]